MHDGQPAGGVTNHGRDRLRTLQRGAHPRDLVAHARRAEEAGFPFALISDHFHPWVDAQGQAPFVWSVIGAIATATERLRLGTGVTCPILRLHPAIVAQAAATSAAMMPGRFFLGLGTGSASTSTSWATAGPAGRAPGDAGGGGGGAAHPLAGRHPELGRGLLHGGARPHLYPARGGARS